ncbi:MAG TPA: choice-of-anchor tandem repeat GloVer-containing protein [Terriglobales bacterium]
MKLRIIRVKTALLLLTVALIAGGLYAQKPETVRAASGALFKTLFQFDNTDGGDPSAALVQGTDGSFYGTTIAGGANDDGTVFKITPQGILTTLHSFDITEGYAPEASMVLGADGNFYGTTDAGGAYLSACNGYGCGTIFKITPGGALTTLYSFCAQAGCPDGNRPGALVQGADGNFYGTTEYGGSDSCPNTCGTVFKITPTGVFTGLYKFTPADGFYPSLLAGLVQASDGNFYGTTQEGGSVPCHGGACGTVFRITPEGVLTSLHSFTDSGAEGAGPSGTLIQATDGNLYGTTGGGGHGQDCFHGGCGTVFKITLQGVYTTLADLNITDGSGPFGLIQGTDGNFYGAANQGGSGECNCGSIFEVTPAGVLTPLHSFNTSGGGYMPFSSPIQATNGTFYGTTFYSTAPNGDYGAVYSFSVGLGPFVKSVPTAGKTGTTVKILGNNLKFATGVTFNGVAATFTVESSTYIKATVPAGATTGPIVVTLPSGTLTSNANFQVLP